MAIARSGESPAPAVAPATKNELHFRRFCDISPPRSARGAFRPGQPGRGARPDLARVARDGGGRLREPAACGESRV